MAALRMPLLRSLGSGSLTADVWRGVVAVAVILLCATSDIGAMGRVPPRRQRILSADGRYRVSVFNPPNRAVMRLQAAFAQRRGGGSFGSVSTFTLVTVGLPEGGFLADGGKVLLTLNQPFDPEQPALAAYSLPSGRPLFTRKLRHLFDREVLDSFAGPKGPRWVAETRMKPRWSEGKVTGVALQLPWGQELALNFGNGFHWTTWTDVRMRPEHLDEEKAWALFKTQTSSAARGGLLVYLGAHGSARSIAPLRDLVDSGEFPTQAAEALAGLAGGDAVLYRLLAQGRLPSGRIAAGKALVAGLAPGDAPLPPDLVRALREATRKDPDSRARQALLDFYVQSTWVKNPRLLAELRLARQDERHPAVAATYDRWIEFLASQ